MTTGHRAPTTTVTRPFWALADQVGDPASNPEHGRRPLDRTRVVAIGRQGDREREREAPAVRAVAINRPPERQGTPEQGGSLSQVARGDRGPDLGAANRSPVEGEGLDDDDIEAIAPTECREGLRRSPSLVAERRIRGHEEAAHLQPSTDPLDEVVVRGLAKGGIERLDDRHRHPGSGQPLEALRGVEQERRSVAGEDLVRMMVEGDDRRFSRAAAPATRCRSR